MKWASKFYNQQYKWMKIDDAEMLAGQEALLEKIDRLSDTPVKKILELGGGKGYFAVAAARRGYEITVIELVNGAARHIHKLAEAYQVREKITIVNGDFYTAEIEDVFDIVCYWDGFGIGSDADQQKLLKRITHWLKPNGSAFIDIYTPWFWAAAAGQEMLIAENVVRKYDFDAINCRMLDTWWNKDNLSETFTQSLRCYSPADLNLLINGLNLKLVHCEPGGAMDYDKGIYIEKAPMRNALSYLAKLNLKQYKVECNNAEDGHVR